MAEERPLSNLDQADLFRQALASDPTEVRPEPEPEPRPPQPEQPIPPQPQPGEPPEPPPPPKAEEGVPSWRLREESERARQAEERATLLENRLREVAAHLQQQGGQAPDFFDDPDKAMNARLMAVIQPFAEETRKTMMAMGRMVAQSLHGADKVDEAEEAFLQARDDRSLDPVDYERVVQAPNRYDAVVQWHRQRQALTRVGTDPDAWFQKQLEEKMNDPQFQAQFLEKIRGGAAARPAETRLPPSLSRSTAVAPVMPSGERSGDLSEQSLWSFATAPPGNSRRQ